MASACSGTGGVMLRQLDRFYRRGATGFAFGCLFLGGCALAATILPMLTIASGDQQERAQRVIRATFRFYLAMLQRLSLLRLDIDGREHLQGCRGRLIVANHP